MLRFLRNHQLCFGVAEKKNILNYLKRLLKYFSLSHLHICVGPDFHHILEPIQQSQEPAEADMRMWLCSIETDIKEI